MRKNTARNAPVVLQSSDEWVEWYHNIKTVAIQQSVLDYCDPYKELNEITSMPERAEPPGIPGPKRENESVQEYTDRVNIFLAKRKLYKALDTDHKTVNKGLSIVSQSIGKSVDRSLLFCLWNGSSVYETLRSLRQRYEPTEGERKNTLRQNFKDAWMAPVKMANIELWTANFANAFEACKAAKVLDVKEKHAIDKFFDCVETLEPIWVEHHRTWTRMYNISLSTNIRFFLKDLRVSRSSVTH